jgi:hypothetical protein
VVGDTLAWVCSKGLSDVETGRVPVVIREIDVRLGRKVYTLGESPERSAMNHEGTKVRWKGRASENESEGRRGENRQKHTPWAQNLSCVIAPSLAPRPNSIQKKRKDLAHIPQREEGPNIL